MSELDAAASPPASESPVVFKKPAKGRQIRKRTGEEGGGEEGGNGREGGQDGAGGSAVVHRAKAARRAADGKLGFATAAGGGASFRKSQEQQQQQGGGGGGGGERPAFAYASERSVQVATDGRATASLETETAFDRDARALRERALAAAAAALRGEGPPGGDDGLYRGTNAYKDHTAGFRREHTVAGDKSTGTHGPLRASQHIRWSVRFDYQPDICKDYKETGYCGYGDSCKFMHDRGDYKAGWQLEREWDEKEKRRKEAAMRGAADDGDEEEGGAAAAAGGEGGPEGDEELPFACFICRRPFTDPVVTKCRHYFCEHCALKHHSRNKNCYVCNTPTNGVFNTAHEILKRAKGGAGATAATTGGEGAAAAAGSAGRLVEGGDEDDS